MADTPFDPSGAVTFDLTSGRVSLEHASERVLAPVDGLAQLCEAAGLSATQAFGLAIGTAMGQRLAKRVAPNAKDIRGVTMERFLEHLRGEFALAGLGVVRMELWGSALLFIVDHAGVPAHLVASVLDGAIEASTGRATACVKLEDSSGSSRYLATSQATGNRVSDWVARGVPWSEVMARLHVPPVAESRGEA